MQSGCLAAGREDGASAAGSANPCADGSAFTTTGDGADNGPNARRRADLSSIALGRFFSLFRERLSLNSDTLSVGCVQLCQSHREQRNAFDAACFVGLYYAALHTAAPLGNHKPVHH